MSRDKHIDGLKTLMRGRVFDEDMIVDVKDYEITDSKQNIFISDFKDRTFCMDDFIYFIVPRDVMKEIVDNATQRGFEAGKRFKQKPIHIEESVDNIE